MAYYAVAFKRVRLETDGSVNVRGTPPVPATDAVRVRAAIPVCGGAHLKLAATGAAVHQGRALRDNSVPGTLSRWSLAHNQAFFLAFT